MDIIYLKFVGTKRAEALNKSGIYSLEDFITYFPTSYINRSFAGNVNEIKQSLLSQINTTLMDETPVSSLFNTIHKEVSIIATVKSAELKTIKNNKKLLTVIARDANNATFDITFFSGVDYFASLYKSNSLIVVNGKPTFNTFSRQISFVHPDVDFIEEEDIQTYNSGGIIPKYKITEHMRKAGISNRVLRKIIANAIDVWKKENEDNTVLFAETLPAHIIETQQLFPREKLITTLHNPSELSQIEQAQYRIKFEEMFWYQLMLHGNRQFSSTPSCGIKITSKSQSARLVYNSLSYKLTADQKQVLRDVAADIASGKPMNRLLQGDVGSGKTIVAILSMLMVIDASSQIAIMCPTEILAEQHYWTITNLLKNSINTEGTNTDSIKLQVELLLGGTKKSQRNIIKEKLQAGEINIIIGTHSLFQKDIIYNNLGLIVIDEQHRFGVSQRAELITLASRSINNASQEEPILPHILCMTATPIPRTLTMTLYGDLDVSTIKTMPSNRLPIKTRVCFDEQRSQIYDFADNEIHKGRQVYIVYPLVEKSEKMAYKSAVEHYEIIANQIFPQYKCGLLHGQMSYQEKENVMQLFSKNEYNILVATTVIEVGIDVPNATIMIIEDADRFGLAQLHQLRGRVGRGVEQSYCFLMTKDDFKFRFEKSYNDDIENERINSILRLKAMQNTNDGFKLSEIDMKLRGPGDMLGTKQSGLPEFRYIDLINDTDIIQKCSQIIKNILQNDPELNKAENQRIKAYYEAHLKEKPNFIFIA